MENQPIADIKRWSLPIDNKMNLKKIHLNEQQVNVYCRFRPTDDPLAVSDYYHIQPDMKSIEITAPEDDLRRLSAVKRYIFSHVFSEKDGQEDVFRFSILQVLKQLFKRGKNGLVFSYGVTNAGKTYTMVGNKKNPGVIKNCFSFLFYIKEKILKKKSKGLGSQDLLLEGEPEFDTPRARVVNEITKFDEELPKSLGEKSSFVRSFTENDLDVKDWFLFNEQFLGSGEVYSPDSLTDIIIKFQSFEIYNEEVYDLLVDKPNPKERKKLTMKEVNKKIVFEDIFTKECLDLDKANKILDKCLAGRSIVETLLNSKSSRSHCVFKIIIEFHLETEKEKMIVERYINIVDLAGAERTKRTENVGNKLKEANKINQSLSCLGRCLAALKDSKMPPYRETKLTRYLSEFFIEDNFIIMIANINPQTLDFEESIRVLNYASVAKEIRPIKSKISTSSSGLKISRKTSSIENYSFGHGSSLTEREKEEEGLRDFEIDKRGYKGSLAGEMAIKDFDHKLECFFDIQRRFMEEKFTEQAKKFTKAIAIEESNDSNQFLPKLESIANDLVFVNAKQTEQEGLMRKMLTQMKRIEQKMVTRGQNSPRAQESYKCSDIVRGSSSFSKSQDNMGKTRNAQTIKGKSVRKHRNACISESPRSDFDLKKKSVQSSRYKQSKRSVSQKRKVGRPRKVDSALSIDLYGMSNLPLFKSHADYRNMNTKKLCEITLLKEQKEAENLEKLISEGNILDRMLDD
jgi:hypothetical protein